LIVRTAQKNFWIDQRTRPDTHLVREDSEQRNTRSDTRATPSGCSLDKEMREARYGRRMQFFVQKPSKELRINVEIGFLKPINRGI
jgi:hypothetical protein